MNKIPQKICRICEQQTAAELINISLQNNFQNFIPKFLACATVTFDITDALPKYFCRNCISILNIAYNFKIKCEQTQKKFQKLLQIDIPSSLISLKIENAEVPTYDVVDSGDDTNLTLDQVFGFSSNVMEDVQIEQNELKFECNDHDEPVEEKTEKLDLLDENYEYIVYEKCENLMKKSPISSEKSLNQHTNKKHTNVLQCKLCDKTFSNSNNLSLHINRIHFEPSNGNDLRYVTGYECFICKNGKLFKEKRYLLRHMKLSHISTKSKPLFPCEICGKNFQCNANKRRHIKVVHLNERSFVCRICAKRFGSLIELENHEPLHSDEKNFKCTQCTEKFKTKQILQRHIRIEHNLPHSTDLTDNDRIKREMEIVQRRRAYNDNHRKCCEICGKTMVYNQLDGHMRMHFGIKPFKCQLCPKTFINKLRLNQHTLVHSGEKPFKCEFCSKSFRQKSHVYQHRRTHTGEKPYKCGFCQKSFATSGNFKEHERLHTGEKPYRCNLCAEKFVNSKALKRHATAMHAGRESEALIYTLPPPTSLY